MASYTVPVPFHQAGDLLSQTSDDEEDNSPRTTPPLTRKSRTRIAIAGGGSEIGRRGNPRKPRGRPPGSKNKPKPALVVTKETDSDMKSAVLEIATGSDIIEMVVQFARRHQLSVTIISGSGSVSNVTLRHPTSHAPSLSFRGPFKLISLTGTILGSSSSSSSSSSFGISLAGQQGQVIGGVVGGKVTAASTVVLVVATFTKPSYHKLSGETEEAEDQPRPKDGGGGGGGGGANDCYSGTSMSMATCDHIIASPTPSNCHAAPEVMNWTGTCPPQPY